MEQSRRTKQGAPQNDPKCIASKAVSMKERFSLEIYPLRSSVTIGC